MGQDPQDPIDHMQPCGILAVGMRAVENPGRLMVRALECGEWIEGTGGAGGGEEHRGEVL